MWSPSTQTGGDDLWMLDGVGLGWMGLCVSRHSSFWGNCEYVWSPSMQTGDDDLWLVDGVGLGWMGLRVSRHSSVSGKSCVKETVLLPTL